MFLSSFYERAYELDKCCNRKVMYTRSQTKLFSRLFFIFLNYNITLVQVRYILSIETKEVIVLDITGLFFRISTKVPYTSTCFVFVIVVDRQH
jgi:hypothetical protein